MPLLRACESGGALEGSLGLAGLAVSQAAARAARASPEFAPGGGGVVLCWSLLWSEFGRVASSGVVSKLATLPTLVW
jgi:hypothetical protein